MTNSASAAENVAEAHRRLRADGDIQFDLPVLQPTPPRAPSPPWFSLPEWSLWLVAGVVVALILWIVVREIIKRSGQGNAYNPRETPEAQWRPEEKVARALLADADALAAQGRYEEAARLLLHRSLEDIRARKPRLLRPALTSREITRIEELPASVRGTFATMADAVERSLFGGRALSREAWETARAAYDAFALKGSWT